MNQKTPGEQFNAPGSEEGEAMHRGKMSSTAEAWGLLAICMAIVCYFYLTCPLAQALPYMLQIKNLALMGTGITAAARLFFLCLCR